MMPESQPLCALNAIPENGTRGFTVDTKTGPRQVFIVRQGGACHGYLNQCPHTGVPLDWAPDQFLDITGKLIQCATHGALFRIEDGYCIHGPCAGQSLHRVQIKIENNMLEAVL